MKRREFIAGLGNAIAWPVLARAQQVAMPVIGFLTGGAEGPLRTSLAAFRRGLNERGYLEGQNVEIIYRWAEGQYHLLPALAAQLVQRRVTAILASGNAAARAARAATVSIPIVFENGSDPVELGLVSSLNRPGGNITGISFLGQGLIPKRLELIHQIVPAAASVGLLVNRSNPTADAEIRQAEMAAGILDLRLTVQNASTPGEIEKAIAELVERRIGAFVTTTDILFSAQAAQLATLAARNSLPAVYHEPEIAYAGGLLSYGANIADAYRLAGNYVGRILKGERPGELPVQQAVKVELVINLKTAKALGLTVPETLLATADEVIQ
jgi:putative tryptophan/tyrosine transport system substrate-binding protein